MLKSRLVGVGMTALATVLGVYLSAANPQLLAAICKGGF